MELYELIECVSKILTPETNSFFDFVISSSDNNGGFLRTCYAKKIEKIRNFNISDMDKVVVCFKNKFVERNYYINYYGNNNFTTIKMQLFYESFGDIEKVIRWSRNVGFKYAYVFDLKEKIYECREVSNDYVEKKRKIDKRRKRLRNILIDIE